MYPDPAASNDLRIQQADEPDAGVAASASTPTRVIAGPLTGQDNYEELLNDRAALSDCPV